MDEKTGEVIEDKYVVYGRSSSKSRTGQCSFIKESLLLPMVNWNKMGLPFIEGADADFAGLLAYTSLVGSDLEDVVSINLKNILIVDDVESKFEHLCNVVKIDDIKGHMISKEIKSIIAKITGKKLAGFLDRFEEMHTVKNSLFDEESLLSSEYFKEGTRHPSILMNYMILKIGDGYKRKVVIICILKVQP